MEPVFFVLLLAAIAYGLQRNHARQSQPQSPLAGSTDVHDRDLERVVHDLPTC
jgi:hypothetical protein